MGIFLSLAFAIYAATSRGGMTMSMMTSTPRLMKLSKTCPAVVTLPATS